MTTCSVCVEKYNISTRKCISCPSCEYCACSTCVRTYILGLTTEHAECMNCKLTWNRKFLYDHLPKSFINKQFKEHVETVLLEREKSLIPTSQHLVIEYNRRKRVEKEIRELRKEKHDLYSRLDIIDNKIGSLYTERREKGSSEKQVFTRKCPLVGCKGFLSSQWKCGICEQKTCNKCNEIITDNHECDPENVETMKLIKSDCKPCPTCAEIIHKIDGCDQMWCTTCHVSFSWRTGREIKGSIVHNPHYYEYMRQTQGSVPRNPRDLPCGELMHIGDIINYRHKPGGEIIIRAHRIITEINDWHIPTLPDSGTIPHDYRETTHLRLCYMLNRIADDNYKWTLQKTLKKRQKLWDYRQILQMMSATGTDIINKWVMCHDDEECQTITNEIINLKTYVNESFLTTSQIYGATPSYILNDWLTFYRGW